MAGIVAYMYHKRRLGMLRQGFGPNSNSLSSHSESESEAESNTSDDLSDDMGTPASSHNSTRPNSKVAVSASAVSAKTKNLQGVNRAKGPYPKSTATKRDHMVVKINSKSENRRKSMSTARQVAGANSSSSKRFAKINASSSKDKGSSNNRSESQDVSDLLTENVEACHLCSSLVPCSDSDIDRQELIYHVGDKPPNCTRIFEAYQFLLLKTVKLLGAELTVCAECRMSFSVPSELLKHLYTHAVIRSRSTSWESDNAMEPAIFGPSSSTQPQSEESLTPFYIDNLMPVKRQRALLSIKKGTDKFGCKRTDLSKMALIDRYKWKRARERDRKYLCQFCGGLYNDLKTHVEAVHMKLLPYKCPHCDKRFARKHQVQVHEGNHKPFYCKICNKYLKGRYHFKQHMEAHAHNNVKKFKCDQCDKSFMRESYLRAHQVIHTGRKPFPCPYCPKGYMAMNHLEIHLKTHYGTKEHKCIICNKEFFSKQTLDTHMRLHSKSHLCEECGMAFVNPSKLKRHFLRVHSKNGETAENIPGNSLRSQPHTEDIMASYTIQTLY